MKVPFFCLQSNAADIAAVKKTLASGWLTTGERAADLEALIKERCGARHAVAVSSATAGLQLALAALDIGPGDEVITTAFTFTATCSAIVQSGAKPVIADIDPVTLNLDPLCVAKKITRRTKAIIAVDIAGLPCDYRALLALCRKRKLKLICDAAHSFGALISVKPNSSMPVGSIGDINVFSFYSTKNLTTAEGGMALTQNKRIAERLRRLSLHGISRSALQRNRAADWRYDVTEIGFKANLSDLNAALGVSRVKRLDSLLASRARVAKWYFRELGQFADYVELPPLPDDRHQAWHLYIIKLNLDRWRIGRDRFIKEFTRLGIGCGVHYIPLHYFSAYAKILAIPSGELYHTEKSYSRVVSLPLYPELRLREIKIVGEALGALVRRYGK
jgi:dTDP-4-amino-4,6-dideoxygalactose transaminase